MGSIYSIALELITSFSDSTFKSREKKEEKFKRKLELTKHIFLQEERRSKMIVLLFWTLAAVQFMGIAESAAVNQESLIRLKDALKEADIPGLGKGWQLIQHYKFGETDDFKNKKWEDYTKKGFGRPDLNGTHYWEALEKLHEITSTGKWQLLIGMLSHSHPSFRLIIYNDFKTGSVTKGYPLRIGTRDFQYPITKEAGAGLEQFKNYPFSTPDMELDVWGDHCAKTFKAGWWFRSCGGCCLNCDDLLCRNPAFERYMAIRKMAEEDSEG